MTFTVPAMKQVTNKTSEIMTLIEENESVLTSITSDAKLLCPACDKN